MATPLTGSQLILAMLLAANTSPGVTTTNESMRNDGMRYANTHLVSSEPLVMFPVHYTNSCSCRHNTTRLENVTDELKSATKVKVENHTNADDSPSAAIKAFTLTDLGWTPATEPSWTRDLQSDDSLSAQQDQHHLHQPSNQQNPPTAALTLPTHPAHSCVVCDQAS